MRSRLLTALTRASCLVEQNPLACCHLSRSCAHGSNSPRLICEAAHVVEGGKGVRFTVQRYGRTEPAFMVRYDGRVHAYLNRVRMCR
jgi:hypothetical protein